MAWFWTWGVRNLAVIAGAMCLLAGADAVVDWSFALTGAAGCGFLAEAAGHFGSKSRRQGPVTVATEQPIDEMKILQFRIADLEEEIDERAA